MFFYYLKLGAVNLKRNPIITALMVITLAVGVAAAMTTLTILRGMSGDPIPHKSDRLFYVQIDTGPVGRENPNGEPDAQMSYTDTMNLWRAAKAPRQTPLMGTSDTVSPERKDLQPFITTGLAVGADFFSMFDVPLLEGRFWSAEQDKAGSDVVVITRQMRDRLFGEGQSAVGKRLMLSQRELTIIGVLDTWSPLPKFYRLVGSNRYGSHEDYFLPIEYAVRVESGIEGQVSCTSRPDPGFQGFLQSDCTWLQYWVELAEAGDRQGFADYLVAYVNEQKKLDRLPRTVNNRLRDVNEWMVQQGVVDNDTVVATWLAFAFLAVCLVNTVGLLLAKFSARPGEIGVRRALGASRAEIFSQFLTEAGVVGLVGAALGILLTLAALAYVRQYARDIALLTEMDWLMLLTTVLISLVAALGAGLLPTWRACQVLPAAQLKSQ
ncbi:MAG: ABC transporter permease [Ahniella sp.]|nr:ABC transporter permease [Ahniella sp.]